MKRRNGKSRVDALLDELDYLERRGEKHHRELIHLVEEFGDKMYPAVENHEIIPIHFRRGNRTSQRDRGWGTVVLIIPKVDLRDKTRLEIEQYYNSVAKEILFNYHDDIIDIIEHIVNKISKRCFWATTWGIITYMRLYYSSNWEYFSENIMDYAIDVTIPNT